MENQIEFTPEFCTEHALTPEQVTAINGYVAPKIEEITTASNGKANENAERIINSVIDGTQKTFKVELPRENGEKHADYLLRLNAHILTENKASVAKLEQEYQEKLKDFQGDEATKAELQTAKEKLEAAQRKLVNYDELTQKAESFESLTAENQTLTKLVTFGAVKPAFPDTVDPRIVRVEWGEFTAKIEKEWDVKLVEGVPTAINKENPLITDKLENLVKKDVELNKLLEGRQQGGTGATETEATVVEGIPFKVNLKAEMTVIHKQIADHLATQNIPFTSPDYEKQYGQILGKIHQQRTVK